MITPIGMFESVGVFLWGTNSYMNSRYNYVNDTDQEISSIQTVNITDTIATS